MLVKEILEKLLEKEINFTSRDFVWGFRTNDYSIFDLELCGLWLVLEADVNSDKSWELCNMSPRITQLSKDGKKMLFAWPFDNECRVVDCTGKDEE